MDRVAAAQKRNALERRAVERIVSLSLHGQHAPIRHRHHARLLHRFRKEELALEAHNVSIVAPFLLLPLLGRDEDAGQMPQIRDFHLCKL